MNNDSNKALKDAEIIELLRSNDKINNDKAFLSIYQRFYKMVKGFVAANSGDEMAAEDIFQDCLIILFKKAKSKDFTLTAGLGTYMYSICKNLWLKELKKSGRSISLDEEVNSIPIEESTLDSLAHSERAMIIASLLDKLGEGCKKIILLYYYDKYRMKEIAQELNLSSEQIAKNKKSNCMKKLRELISANIGLKEFFRF